MQKVIYKYPIPFEDIFSLDLPEGARILSFGTQYETLQIWVLIDRYTLDPETKKRQFALIGTGRRLPDLVSPETHFDYIGTTTMAQGDLVWHLFEIVEQGGDVQ